MAVVNYKVLYMIARKRDQINIQAYTINWAPLSVASGLLCFSHLFQMPEKILIMNMALPHGGN